LKYHLQTLAGGAQLIPFPIMKRTPIHENLAARGSNRSDQASRQRRLAGAAFAKNPDYLILTNDNVYRSQRLHIRAVCGLERSR
jgi:hypothetical protein